MCEAPGRGTFDTNVGRKSTYVPPTSWETRELQLERFWNLASFNSSVLEPRSRSDLHFTGGMQGDLQAGVTLGDLVGSGLLLIGDSGDWGSTIFVVAIAWGTNAQPCVARDQAGKQETCTKHSGIFMVMIGLPATSLTATALARASEVVHDEETKKPTNPAKTRRAHRPALVLGYLQSAFEGLRRGKADSAWSLHCTSNTHDACVPISTHLAGSRVSGMANPRNLTMTMTSMIMTIQPVDSPGLSKKARSRAVGRFPPTKYIL